MIQNFRIQKFAIIQFLRAQFAWESMIVTYYECEHLSALIKVFNYRHLTIVSQMSWPSRRSTIMDNENRNGYERTWLWLMEKAMKSGKPNLWHFAHDLQTYVCAITSSKNVVNCERFDMKANVLKFITKEGSKGSKQMAVTSRLTNDWTIADMIWFQTR